MSAKRQSFVIYEHCLTYGVTEGLSGVAGSLINKILICLIRRGLKSLRENYHDEMESRRACPELVERGRLNLAQDAVLGCMYH